MKMYICNNPYTYIWDFHIPLNAWYGQDDKSWWICTKHALQKDGGLYLRRFNGVEWVERLEKSTTTCIISQIATKHNLWYTKIMWFKAAEKSIREQLKNEKQYNNYVGIMKHPRKHKTSKGGIPLWKDYKKASCTFTEYECTNHPLSDFLSYYI